MTAIGPYSQALNYTFQTDIRPSGKVILPPDNTIMGFLDKHSDFSLFRDIVYTAGLESTLSYRVIDTTLFVPMNKSFGDFSNAKQFVKNMDTLTARMIVQFSMLNRKICSELLTASPHRYFITKLASEKLEVTNLNCKCILNQDVEITNFNICVDNGVIHIVNKPLIPRYFSSASYFSQTY